MKEALRKEIQVAFSATAQPRWFRIIKYIILIPALYYAWKRGWLIWLLPSLITVVCIVHGLYRHKTNHWTRPWGGWHDKSILNSQDK